MDKWSSSYNVHNFFCRNLHFYFGNHDPDSVMSVLETVMQTAEFNTKMYSYFKACTCHHALLICMCTTKNNKEKFYHRDKSQNGHRDQKLK